MRRYKQSALEIINETFEDEHSRAFMLWLAFMTVQRVDRPFTGRLAYAIANGRQNYSWTTPEGGSGALPKALVALIEAHMGAVLTDQPVTQLILENGRCVRRQAGPATACPFRACTRPGRLLIPAVPSPPGRAAMPLGSSWMIWGCR